MNLKREKKRFQQKRVTSQVPILKREAGKLDAFIFSLIVKKPVDFVSFFLPSSKLSLFVVQDELEEAVA